MDPAVAQAPGAEPLRETPKVPVVLVPAATGQAVPEVVQLPAEANSYGQDFPDSIAKLFAPPPQPSPDEDFPKHFFVNLAALVVGLALVAAWVYHFTDYFEVFLSVLSLTGFFAWASLFFRLIPDDRFKVLQKKFADTILNGPYTWRIVVGLLLGCILIVSCLGSLQIDNTMGGTSADVWLYRPSTDDKGDPSPLPVNGHIREVFWAPWWSSRTIEVKVAGYPALPVPLRPWRRVERQLPYSFFRPVVLLGTNRVLVNQAQLPTTKKLQWKVQIIRKATGELIKLEPVDFDGHAVWLGCGDLEVPPYVRNEWQEELQDKLAASFLLAPQLYPNAPVLAPQDKVIARLIFKETGVNRLPEKTIIVRSVQGLNDLVQPLQLNSNP